MDRDSAAAAVGDLLSVCELGAGIVAACSRP